MIRAKKVISMRLWEHLIIAAFGGMLEPEDQVCGIVISVRYQEDIISIWNKDSQDEAGKEKLKESFAKYLNLPPSTIFEYKAHDQSLRDNSSYRNTDKFKS